MANLIGLEKKGAISRPERWPRLRRRWGSCALMDPTLGEFMYFRIDTAGGGIWQDLGMDLTLGRSHVSPN